MKILLQNVISAEGIPEFPDTVVEKIIKVAEGIPREALTLLDSVITIAPIDEKRSLEIIEETYLSDVKLNKLCQALIDSKWTDVSKMLEELTSEPEQTRYSILGYMRKVLLNSQVSSRGDKIAKIIRNFQESFIYSGKAGLALACYLSCRS
jgi:DNA polymerase III gamma/tau subunit